MNIYIYIYVYIYIYNIFSVHIPVLASEPRQFRMESFLVGFFQDCQPPGIPALVHRALKDLQQGSQLKRAPYRIYTDLYKDFCNNSIFNCPLKGIGVRDIIINLGDFSFLWEVFHWTRIELSSKSCVFRGRELRLEADS